MTASLEHLLRDTFEADAQDAPVTPGPAALAGGARARLRRRRLSLGGSAAAAAVAVLTVGVVAWGGPTATTRPAPGPATNGGVTVLPQPSVPDEYCPTAATCDQKEVFDGLRGAPLRLPEVAPGASCPVSATHMMPKGAGFNTDYPAIGDGPFRLTGPPRIDIPDPPEQGSSFEGTGWNGMKVIWHIDASYSGPVLLRGARIDAPGPLRFDRYLGALGRGDEPTGYDELAYPAWESDGETVRTLPSGISLQAPGCYAVQADGWTFSRIIVFQAAFVRR